MSTTSQVLCGAVLGGSLKSAVSAPVKAAGDSVLSSSSTQLATMIQERRITSLELVSELIARIKEVDPKVKAVVSLLDESALAGAKAADEALEKGQRWGPLHGVPISIKDNLDVEGVPTACGAPAWKRRRATVDATVVRKVKDAGAIILAKTNVPFQCSGYEAFNLFCRTSNPYDLTRTCGGSSGGEAALIAYGGSPCGIGSDTGGSIRVPSHFCGIAGLRPAHGRVSLAGMIPRQDTPGPLNHTTNGPMARFVEDLATLMPIISGPDDRDPFVWDMQWNNYQEVDRKSLHIGWWTGDGEIDAGPETSAVVALAAKELEKVVGSVMKTNPPYRLKRMDDILVATIAESFPQFLSAELERLGASEDRLMLDGIELLRDCYGKFSASQIDSLRDEVKVARRTVHASMRHFDAIVCPVTLNPAMEHGTSWSQSDGMEFCCCEAYSWVWTLPAGTVRCGTSRTGLPIGVQVVGASHREDIVLSIMSFLESALEGWKAPIWLAVAAR